MCILTAIFYYGLFGYLGVNFKGLPRDGVGLLLNLGLVVLLGVNLVFLGKFWLEWNFITTISNFSWLSTYMDYFSYCDCFGGQLCTPVP